MSARFDGPDRKIAAVDGIGAVMAYAYDAAGSFGQADYYHQDGLGSIVGLSNNLNTTTQTQRFDAWGNKLIGTITQSAQYGYTGREPDETGLTLSSSAVL